MLIPQVHAHAYSLLRNTTTRSCAEATKLTMTQQWRRNTLGFKSRFKETVEVPFDLGSGEFLPRVTCNIKIYQSEEPDSTLWDASVVLSRYLCTLDTKTLEHKRVIELGAGCGLVGIVAAMKGAHVAATDMQEYIPLINQNISANLEHIQGAGSVFADTLDWGNLSEIQTKFKPPVDFIVGSDIVYALQGFDDLVATMDCLSSTDTQIILAYEHRWNDVEAYFVELVEKHFTVTKIPYEDPDPRFQLPAVQIFKLQKKVNSNANP